MWYAYTMEYYSAIKMNETVPFVEMWMDPETVIQSEVSQKEKNKYCMLTHICRIQKNGTNELICRARIEAKNRHVSVRRGAEMWDEFGN